MPKKTAKGAATSRKKTPSRKKATKRPAKSSPGISFLPDSGIDFSNARLEEIFYDAYRLDLRISQAIQPATTSDINVRFEGIQDSTRVTFELGDILFRAFGRKQFKPKAKFYRFKSKRTQASYPWRVEIALAPLRKPYAFSCKRIRITTKKGKLLAGDTAPVRPKWKIKDYKQFAERIAGLILDGSYQQLIDLMHVELRKKKKSDQISREFERWKRTPQTDSADKNSAGKQQYIIQIAYTDLDGGFVPEGIGRLDPDTIRAELTIEFCALFLLDLVIVSHEDTLFIGKYRASREW